MDRFHQAAKDGYIDVLKETTKKDCNTGDEDGMTPTLWTAFEGNLEAMRLLVGRGGDPEKTDNYGNTALHLASAKGHMQCVSFLVNFGVNIWALDIDMHTAQELAAMNDCTEILRYLDNKASEFETKSPTHTKKCKEKAEKEVGKLIKNFQKIQKKADKISSKKEKELDRKMNEMTIGGNGGESNDQSNNHRRKSTLLDGFRRESNNFHSTPTFSEMTGTTSLNKSRKSIGTVFRKTNTKRNQNQNDPQFKVRSTEMDGTKTVRNISGLRRDSEIIFVAPKTSERKNYNNIDSPDENDYIPEQKETIGIFDRPGFGSVAFRPSLSASLFSFPSGTNSEDPSIGSAGSFVGRHNEVDEEDEDDDDALFGDEDDDDSNSFDDPQINILLAALGLSEYMKIFRREEIDLNALMMLTEDDLKNDLNIPIGPRKKIMKAINDRKKDIADDTSMQDSQL